MSHRSLEQIDHRPYSLPTGRWRFDQVWSELAFLHWPVSTRWLRTRVPLGLEIDEFDGTAWIGVVPFRLRIRLRGLPAIPRVQVFPELNVRTYVTAGGRPGVWFFSLDAPSPLAIWAARRWFHLPYFRARFEVREQPATSGDGAGWIHYHSTRLEGDSAEFGVRYRPTGPLVLASPGTLDHFLTERYCLYSADPAGMLYRADVHHAPWPLQAGEAEIATNTITAPLGLELEGAPRVAFSRRVDVATWPLESLASGR